MEILNIHLIKQEDLKNVITLLSKLKTHSRESYVHSIDVADKAVIIANSYGLSMDEIQQLYTAGLLHDIGKLYVTQDLLHKKNATKDEQDLIRFGHIVGTKSILSQYFDDDFVNLASHHHERLNRTGYPEHLGSRRLSTLDRILQVADVTSALAMKRSYKEPFSNDKVCSILDELVNKGELDKHCVEEAKKLLLVPYNIPSQMGS